jgi:hypothetical protein
MSWSIGTIRGTFLTVVDHIRHCERSEAIQDRRDLAPGLLRRFAPRNDESVVVNVAPK